MPVTIFIGSSTEGKPYAQAIADVIQSLDYKVQLWSEAFRIGDTFIESLIRVAEEVDAALFVATADDHRIMRGREDSVTRDNVLFEYGLFSGKLGRSRTALAIVANAVVAMDLSGINCISLPKNESPIWTDYEAAFVRPQVHKWLRNEFEIPSSAQSIANLKRHIYKCLETEAVAKEKEIFQGLARESPVADYLVLRGRNILSEKGEIADLCKRADPQLRARLLVVDFESLTEETFKEIKANMDLQFADLNTEKRLATERLAFARQLSRQVTLTCRLLPINVFPAMKLRLYDRRGFFYFYHTDIAGNRWAGTRSVFCVDVPRGERSPLLETLRQIYNHLWDKGGNL
jgi:Predicted nucleotide-binding protein containing TIR-like domain